MDDKTVFIKTAKGEEEADSYNSQLSGDAKRVFILIDGKSTVAHLRKNAAPSLRPDFDEMLERLVERGEAAEVRVEGIDRPCYLRLDDRATLERTLSQALDPHDPPLRAAILAPLDNLMWDRRLLQELFGFEYLWEVYKPVVERRWGYYVLPILYGDRFIARFEPGRDKGSDALTIQNWWWEPGTTPSAPAHRPHP